MKSAIQRIVLTGATGGIGCSIAHELDQQGYSLLLVGRDENKLDKLLDALSGNQHEKVVANLTEPEGIAVLKVASMNFEAEGLINCLGTNQLATLIDTQDADVERMISTNLLAPINICKALIPILTEQTNAVIINVGSALGSIGYAGSSVYCASKFGLRGFTESLRRELADTGVSVIYLAPRATNTALNSEAMNQMNKALGNTVDSPRKVAKRLAQLLKSGKSVDCYLGWPESLFVKLNGLIPAVVDRALYKQLSTIRHFCGLDRA